MIQSLPHRWPCVLSQLVLRLAVLASVIVGASVSVAAGPAQAPGAAPGTPLWSYRTGGAIWSAPVVRDGVLYVGSDDRRLHAVDVHQRRARWTYATGGAVRSRPLVVASRVLIASDDGWLHALDRQSGRRLWRFDLKSQDLHRRAPSPDNSFYDFLQSSPVEKDGVVYVGSTAGHLFAVRLEDGRELWKLSTAAELRATPLLVDDLVVAGSWDGNVYAADARTGQVRWVHKAEGIVQGAAAAVGGHVILGSRAAKLFGLETATGRVSWTRTLTDGSWIESSPVGDGKGGVYVGSSDSLKLFALDGATGRERWAYDTGGWAWSTPVLSGDTVYIGALSAHPYYMPGVTLQAGFHAVDATTGQRRWVFRPPAVRGFITGGVAVAPAVEQGVVYVAAVDGRVYALKE